MNLDELKTAWIEYGHQLKSTQIINEKIIISMIKEKSRSRLSKMKREYFLSAIYMIILLVVFTSILIGNPFDFKYNLQYVPTAFYCVSFLIILLALIKGYLQLNIDINHDNLDVAMKKVIENHGKSEKIIGRRAILLMSAAFLFPLSFAPKNIEHLGLWKGIGVTVVQMSLIPLFYFIAVKLGAFKNVHSIKLKEDLNELNELKAISRELVNE